MKLISFVVPSYNSEAYLKHCIETLLTGGDEVEILIVNDGSKDNTGKIADEYEKMNPGMIRAIHQENGGHGEAVNTGIRNATGIYFKVVDSDDWVDEAALKKVLGVLRQYTQPEIQLDLVISNYVYENAVRNTSHPIKYKGMLPENCVFSWDEVGRVKKGRYMIMHSMIYRTQLLHESGIKLPKHTFYVDNLFMYEPLPLIKRMYYINVDFYRYFIGRNDQSVNESVHLSRIDQQIFVNHAMIDFYLKQHDLHPRLQRYLYDYLEIITVVSSIILIKSSTKEHLQMKRQLWADIKKKDAKLYHKLRNGLMGRVMNLHGPFGRKIAVLSYNIAKKIIGFN